MATSVSGSQITFSDLTTQNTAASGFGFHNRIINGAMGVWQRGTSGFTTSGVYCADRWIIGTGSTLTSVGQSTDVPTGFKYSLSAAGTNQPTIYQKVEAANSTDLVGQSVTLSFWCKQTVGSGTNSLYASFYYANSSDNFGAVTQIGSTVFFTGTTGWVQYSTTFTNLPSGAANGVEIAIGNVGAGSATFLITGVQLEKGPTATAFDYRPYGTELMLCQRYYYPLGYTRFSGTQASGTSIVFPINFPVSMRVTPTGTLNSVVTNANYVANPTTASQWGFVQSGIGYPTKTGTVSIYANANTQDVGYLAFIGATYSTSFNQIVLGNGSGDIATFSAEL